MTSRVMISMKILFFTAFVSLMACAAFASDKPVKIEELIAQKQNWETDFIISYNSLHRKKGEIDNQIIEQQGNIISVSDHEDRKTNTDRIYYYLGLKYGILENLEISAFGSGYSEFSRNYGQDDREYDRATKFNNAGIEVAYQIRQEDEYPALITSLSTHVTDNTEFPGGYEKSWFKTHAVRAITYYTIDPVIFSLDSRYTVFLERKNRKHSIDPGEKFSLSPVLYFIVNPYATVYWGFEFYIQGSSTRDGEKAGATKTGLPLIIGCGYEINRDLTLDVNFEYEDTAGVSQTSASFELNYVF